MAAASISIMKTGPADRMTPHRIHRQSRHPGDARNRRSLMIIGNDGIQADGYATGILD